MNKLRNIIREIVEQELDEMARISTNIKIGDAEKLAAAKELYSGTWLGDMIDFVEAAGETGIPQPELAKKLGKSGMQSINPKIRDFVEANIFSKGELSVPKKEKPESSGIKGRPTSEKTLMAKTVNSKLEADANYEPTEAELAMLGDEFIEKLRMRVKGLLKRGRPLGASTAKDGMTAAPKTVANAEDTNADGEIDDEDIEDALEESQTINESFLKMQKLAGLITESEFKKKIQLNEDTFNDEDKALGTLFHSDEEDRYTYDVDAIANLIKSMGYKDYEDVANEFTHYFSPGDEDEMRIFRAQENNPKLQPTDLTIGMYKRNIEKEFEK